MNPVHYLDINECDTGNGGCAQTCVNLRGAMDCECDDGYIQKGFSCIGRKNSDHETVLSTIAFTNTTGYSLFLALYMLCCRY